MCVNNIVLGGVHPRIWSDVRLISNPRKVMKTLAMMAEDTTDSVPVKRSRRLIKLEKTKSVVDAKIKEAEEAKARKDKAMKNV